MHFLQLSYFFDLEHIEINIFAFCVAFKTEVETGSVIEIIIYQLYWNVWVDQIDFFISFIGMYG